MISKSIELWLHHGEHEKNDILLKSNLKIENIARELLDWYPSIPQSADFVWISDDGEVESLNWDLYCEGYYERHKDYIQKLSLNPIRVVIIQTRYDSTIRKETYALAGRHTIK
jgi:hypothetical protein